MKICFASSGKTLDSLIDPRFGRCPYFIFLDPEKEGDFEVLENSGLTAARGAGVVAAQTAVEKGAKAVIAGNIGPNALMVLRGASIPIFSASGLTVKEAVARYKEKKLPELKAPTGGGFGRRYGR